MLDSEFQPLFQLTRGETIESTHLGSAAVVDAAGQLIAWVGDPYLITFLRSSAKPFQTLPFLEHGGQTAFNLTPREIALICASHSGTDKHVSVLKTLQNKTGVAEADLLCGVHSPYDEPTAEAMKERREAPTPNRHNCSGKHTGMLALAHMLGESTAAHSDSPPYIDIHHPVQVLILRTFAEMCALPPEDVRIGIDGCSAPNFAVPLYNAALAYARLCDPDSGKVEPEARAAACRTVTSAMIFNPDMVAGPGRFDSRLMEVGQGRFVVKGGAEGFQAVGLMPGALGPGSPALGIAIKVSDGDLKSRVRPPVTLELLRQLGALNDADLGLLSEFGPVLPVYNWRKIAVGEARPVFTLQRAGSA